MYFKRWEYDRNYTDKASLTMKKLSDFEIKDYLSKISDEALFAYNVYQIEGLGKTLFSKNRRQRKYHYGICRTN